MGSEFTTLDGGGAVSRWAEPDAGLLRGQLEEVGATCRSGQLVGAVLASLPRGYLARLLPPQLEFSPGQIEPFTVEQPQFTGEAGAWHPDISSFVVRASQGRITSYLSESSYWPALLDGAGGLLERGPGAGLLAPDGRVPVRQACYGLQPCARPEATTGRLRRMAFTQAHIDLAAAAIPEVQLCLDALASIYRLIRTLTGLPAASVRARVGDSRAWTSLLAPYARPRAVQDLRAHFLDPAAARAALDGADPGRLASGVRSALHRAGFGLPAQVAQVIEDRIRTGDYEPGAGGTGTRAAELARLCAEAGISAMIDPRSARISYSGLTWQIDCQNSSGWVEVAGGGDYTDAVALLHWLRGHPSPAPPVRVAGSAAGIERLMATAVS